MIKIKEEEELDTLSNRLVHVLELTGTKKADLARAIKVKPQIIQFLCASSTRSSRFTFEIATVLGLNTRWLATGEGEMFLADDPKHTFLGEYKRIPVLTIEQLLLKAQNQPIDIEQHKNWSALKTDANSIFCTKSQDTAMEPLLPAQALVFFDEPPADSPKNGDIVLIFIPQNAIIIREISIEDSKLFMVPKNHDLFKKMQITHDTKILGIAIECHWSIKRQQEWLNLSKTLGINSITQ